MVEWKVGRIRIRNLEIFTFIVLAIIYSLAIIIEPDTLIYDWIENLSIRIRNFAENSSNAYLTAFLICLGGNSTVLIVVPYALVIYLLCIQNTGALTIPIFNLTDFNIPIWIIIAIISGLGAAAGEIVSYYAGRLVGGIKQVEESEMGEKFHRMKIQFEKNPKVVPIFVFLFALTPLPDDVILVPLGMMKYNYKQTIFPSILGKTILTSVICWLGYMAGIYQNFLDQLIEEMPWTVFLRLFIPSSEVNPTSDLITFSFVFIFIYLVARVNFTGIVKRFSKDRKKFQKLVKDGGKKSVDELIEEYNVVNHDGFQKFLNNFAEQYPNITKEKNMIIFDEISDRKLAYRQSMIFMDYFYTTEESNSKKEDNLNATEEKQELS